MILGRTDEITRIGQVLADTRAGSGSALVIRGEAGIGKTALLDHTAEAATGLGVVRGVGIESEGEVPYAGLHLLLHPYMNHIEALPEPQAEALRTALGLAEPGISERFLIGAATLSLLSELADEHPLVCLVDDAQWFDQASIDALLFAARRLQAEQVAIVFAVRDGAGHFPATGLNTITLTTLDRASAMTLLDGRGQGLAGPTRARILAEAAGNPLAIIEFTAALTERQHGGGGARALPVEPLPVAGRVQDAFQDRIGGLPENTRRILTLAAADDSADATAVIRAAEHLGLSAADMEPAEHARFIELTADKVIFRHPLIRAAAYRGAPLSWLVSVHRALADTLNGDQNADRRAWHLAAATTVPDEQVAVELERVAHRAAQRGGSAATAAALERAADLSTDQSLRGRRLMEAGRAAYDAGWLDKAAELAATGAALSTDEAMLAESAWIQAQVAYEQDSPAAAARLMLDGVSPILRSRPERAVSILTDAIGCAKDAGEHDLIRQSAQQLAAVPLAQDSPLRPVADGMIGLGDLVSGATERGIARMRALVMAVQGGQIPGLVERVLAGYLALVIADDEAATEVLGGLAADSVRQGSLGWLPYAQEPLAIAQLLRGRFRDADSTITEALSLSAELGQETQVTIMSAIPAWLAAVTGDTERCRAAAEQMLSNEARHPTNAALATWALGLLELGRGRFDAAVDHLETVCDSPARHDFVIRAIPDYVEAAVRSGRPKLAMRYLPTLEHWAAHTAQAHAAALADRCHALAVTGDDAELHYTSALHLHTKADRPYDLARTELLYGEWLRRHRRRAEAHIHLTTAWNTFDHLRAEAWTTRAAAELSALGDRPTARPHDSDPLARLTPQERQVSRLAAAGLSNRDIASQLFLSPRTVGHHLYRAFPKLGISKRTELAQFTFSDRR